MKKFNIKSYCKINLSLKIIKKLKNGYHSISSLITFCDLYDIISVSKINTSKDKVIFSGKFSKGIDKKVNTATKVLALLRKQSFIKNQSFKINIQKNIPHGSGLGGGSSNASNLLHYFNYGIIPTKSSKTMLEIDKSLLTDILKNLIDIHLVYYQLV